MTDTTITPPAAPTAVPAAPAANPAKLAEPAKKSGGFQQKFALLRKKYEYMNGPKKLDKAAAEAQARSDLGLPEMTDAEKAHAGEKNIFEKMMGSRLAEKLGIAALIHGKKEELKADLKAQVDAKLSPAVSAPTANSAESPQPTAPQVSQPVEPAAPVASVSENQNPQV